MKTLKEMVVNKQRVHFQFYRDRQLWYATECGFEFPVPIDEVGNATLLAADRAILFMRYLRKQLQLFERAKKLHNGVEYVAPDKTDE